MLYDVYVVHIGINLFAMVETVLGILFAEFAIVETVLVMLFAVAIALVFEISLVVTIALAIALHDFGATTRYNWSELPPLTWKFTTFF